MSQDGTCETAHGSSFQQADNSGLKCGHTSQETEARDTQELQKNKEVMKKFVSEQLPSLVEILCTPRMIIMNLQYHYHHLQQINILF